MIYYEKEIERNYVFEGQVIKVRVDTVEMPDGSHETREVVEHNGGVGVVPIDENGNVYLVRQYRRAIGRDMLEVPAGKLNPGEDPLGCGIRELKEETGLTARDLTYLCGSLPTPGYASETIHLYMATGLTQGEMELDNNEFINVEVHHIDDVIKMAMDGEITDGKTLIAIFMAKNKFSRQ